MRSWFLFEQRWLAALVEAMIPADPAKDRPGVAAARLDEFAAVLDAAAPPILRFGLRASVWLLTWMTLWPAFGGRPFHRLAADRRDAFLVWAGTTDAYLVRQLATTIKLIACFRYFDDPELRRRAGAAV